MMTAVETKLLLLILETKIDFYALIFLIHIFYYLQYMCVCIYKYV